MDLVGMQSLLAVAQHRSLTDAARVLGVTQPALSRRIRQVEEELGAELFERSTRGMRLNEVGRLVEHEARELLGRYNRMRHAVRAHLNLEAGTVRLGGGATAVSFLLPEAIAAFREQFPGVTLQVKEAGSREIEADVGSERLEIGIITQPATRDDLEVHPLRKDSIVVVAAADHPLARRRGRLPACALAGEDVVAFEAASAIRHIIDDALRDAGVELNVVMELRSIPAILQMVAATKNLGFVSQLAVPKNDRRIRALAVRGLRIDRGLAVVHRRGGTLSPAAAAFVALVQRMAG